MNSHWDAEGASQVVGEISLLTAYPATENTLRAPTSKPRPSAASLLTCRAAECGGFHDGISRTWVSHSSDPSPHHPCTTSPRAGGTLGRTGKGHQRVKHSTQKHRQRGISSSTPAQMLFWAHHVPKWHNRNSGNLMGLSQTFITPRNRAIFEEKIPALHS